MYTWNTPETKIETIPKKEMLSKLIHSYQAELKNTLKFKPNEEKSLRRIFSYYYVFVEKADCYKIFAGSDQSILLKTIQAI